MGLEITDLLVTYGGPAVLDGLSTGVMPRGEVAALVGPNGAGKTTLFRAVAGLAKPRRGRVTLDGGDLARLPPRTRARTVFHLAQDSGARVALSVFEVILLARKSLANSLSLAASPDDMRRVEAVIAELGLGALAQRDIATLSGGQLQLAAIGQALVRDPEVLLLDEPTSSLDMRRQLEVMEIVQRVTRARRMVTLVAIHDLSLAARFADRALLMADGRIARAGAPAEVLADEAAERSYGVRLHLETSGRGTLLVEPYLAEPVG